MSLILHATHRSLSKCYAKNLIESSLSDQMGNGSSSLTTELKVKTAEHQGLLRTASDPHFQSPHKTPSISLFHSLQVSPISWLLLPFYTSNLEKRTGGATKERQRGLKRGLFQVTIRVSYQTTQF